MTKSLHRGHRDQGFSLIEMVVVVGLIAVVSAIAIPVSISTISRARADSSAESTFRAISAARTRAIAERRNIYLTLESPNRIRLERQEIDDVGQVVGLTEVANSILEGGQEFRQFPGQGDTEDDFGASAPINYGGPMPVMFTTDGSLVDAAGDVVNASIFVGVPNQPTTARAVTILGVSGLMRTWKWDGTKWVD